MKNRSFLQEHGMFLSMLVIFAAMALVTKWWTGAWSFVSPENLSNLSQQVTQTGILAIGMTMVILIGGIDLSVGSVLAVSAVVLALFADPSNIAQVVTDPALRSSLQSFANPYVAILLSLTAGGLIGAWNGTMVSRFKLIPFIVTLATLTIARGLAYLVSGSQVLTVKAGVFRVIGVYSLDRLGYEWLYRIKGLPAAALEKLGATTVPQSEWVSYYVENLFLPDVFGNGLTNPAKLIPGAHCTPAFTVGFMILCYITWLVLTIRMRGRHAAQGYEAETAESFQGRAIMVAVGFAVLAAVFAAHQGIPVMVIIFAALALAASFVLKSTVFGRHLYAIGGNKVAAHLSGVQVPRCTFFVFLLMGLLSAASGIVSTSRAQSATPATQGVLGELEAIAAVVVGGTSLMGGVGSIGGTVIGVLIIGIVVNGMILMALPNPVQLIFKGLLIMIAVFIDMRTKRAQIR